MRSQFRKLFLSIGKKQKGKKGKSRLFVRYNKARVFETKIDLQNSLPSKLKIDIIYDAAKGKKARRTKSFYYSINDDEKLSKFFRDKIKRLIKDNFLSFIVQRQGD